MLHMVVITHGPDTCAAARHESAELLRKARAEMKETSQKLAVAVQGWWVDAPGHVFYLLADAPNAHVLNNLMTDLKLFHWNTVDVHSIVTMDDAMALVAQ